MKRSLPFVKGHGTENDFVLIPDPEGVIELSDADVIALCDRRAGLGADGVIRVVRTAKSPEVAHLAGAADWFMDYRNADGSIAQMCGNGARVFVCYLLTKAEISVGVSTAIATRGGVRLVEIDANGRISIDMGIPEVPTLSTTPVVSVANQTWDAMSILIPNPHAVVFVDRLDDAGLLVEAPGFGPQEAFPGGVNVEFVQSLGVGHIAMRVFERGVGETRSCGTGACAAAIAARRRVGNDAPRTWVVDVPGGRLTVTEREDAHVVLAGPAELVAEGSVRLP